MAAEQVRPIVGHSAEHTPKPAPRPGYATVKLPLPHAAAKPIIAPPLFIAQCEPTLLAPDFLREIPTLPLHQVEAEAPDLSRLYLQHKAAPHAGPAHFTLNNVPYELDRILGTGGFGRVFLIHDAKTGEKYAIKIARKAPANAAMVLQCEGQDAQALALHEVPGIAPCVEIGKNYILYKYIEGYSLVDHIRAIQDLRTPDGKVSARYLLSILTVMVSLCKTMKQVGAKDIVHGDLCGANVLIENGDMPGAEKSVVIDFGLASYYSSSTEDSSGKIKVGGKPRYMSPEQMIGERLDHRSDIYSVGLLFYFLLTGEIPFDSEDNFFALLNLKATQGVFPKNVTVKSIFPKHLFSIGHEIVATIDKMTARDKAARHERFTEIEALIMPLLNQIRLMVK